MLDMIQDAGSFLERTAGRHNVIEDESSLIHGRKQVAAQRSVTNIGDTDQNYAQPCQPNRMLQGAAHPALVEFKDVFEHASL